MSKCKAVQDEMKITEICIRKKEEGAVVEKKEIKSVLEPKSQSAE